MPSTQPTIGAVLLLAQAPDGNFYPVACTAPVSASGTLTSDNTNVSDGETVVFTGAVGTFTYVFRTTLTGVTTERQVLIGATADASLANLAFAVNSEPIRCPYGTFGAVTSHTLVFTANNDYEGSAGNTIGTTETSAHLSWGAANLASGLYGLLRTSA